MVLSEEDHILIKHLYYFNGYGVKRLISEFPAKDWKKTTVNDFLKRLKETGSTTRKSGSGKPRTFRTVANIRAVNDIVLRRTHLRHIVQHDRLLEKRASIVYLLYE